MNWLFFPVVALAAVLFVAGSKVGARRNVHWLVYAAAVACALPGVLFALYYLHWFDDAAWFYEFRSWPLTELAAAGAGLAAGFLHARAARRGLALRPLIPLLLLAGLFVPYLKPVVAPLDLEGLKAECRDGICLQTAASTCGPASVASILRLFRAEETEKTLAREAYTSASGTENWYLARALRRRGLSARYVLTDLPVTRLPYPSLAGVRLPGGGGHYVAVLGETDRTYIVADPMVGRLDIAKSRLDSHFRFTGFFMVVGGRVM